MNIRNLAGRAFAIALAAASWGNCVAATETLALPAFNEKPRYCLFITVDGFDRDYITTETTPNLVSWQSAGASLPDAINVYPTATTPNMSSLYTGAWPSHTGVGGNLVFYKHEKRIHPGPRPKGVKTLNDAFKAGGKATAGVQMYMMDKADRYVHHNQVEAHDVTTMTLEMLKTREEVPDLMVVLFQTVDHIGHKFGPDSPQAKAEAHLVDAQIAAIVARYKELGLLQDTLVVISADHGMSATEHQVDQPTMTKALSGLGFKYQWLVQPTQKVSDDVDFYLMQAGNLQGYFNRPFSLEEKQKLFKALQSVEGLGALHDSETLRRMNCAPSGGDFVVEPAPGWRLRGNRGTHGTNRESDGYETLFGAGVRLGVSVKGARTIDLMPTVLEAMGLQVPETVDGRALREVLIQRH